MDQFLKKFRTSENGDFVNYLKDERYSIDDDSIADFWHEVCIKNAESSKFCLYEVLKEKSTINALIHLNYPSEEETPLPSSFIRKLIYSFQKVFISYLSIETKQLLCAVSTANTDLDYYVLLQFPYFSVTKKLRDEVLTKLVTNEIRINNVIGELHSQPTNDFLDKMFYDEIPIHGSTFTKTGRRFTFYNFYKHIVNQDDIFDDDIQLLFSKVFHKSESALYQASLIPKQWFKNQTSESTKDTESTFSRVSRLSSRGEIHKSFYSESDRLSRMTDTSMRSRISDNDDFWLPFFLSAHYPRNVAYLTKEARKIIEEEQKKNNDDEEVDLDCVKEILDICALIPQKILWKEPYVTIIGRICFNTTKGGEEGFNTWRKICNLQTEWKKHKEEKEEDEGDDTQSRLSSISGSTLYSRTTQIDEENGDDISNLSELLSRRTDENPDFSNDDEKDYYVRLWKTFGPDKNSHYTIASLHHLAYSVDGEVREKYKYFIIKNSYPILKKASTLLDSYVADLFHYHYPANFLYDTSKTGSWYYYENHKWEVDKSGLRVHKYISGPFTNRIRESINYFNQKFSEEKDEEKRKNNAKFIENLTKLEAECQKHPYKNKLTNELREKYVNSLFNKIRDENPRLITMKNGILEIDGAKIYFRKGLPEDYTTYSTRINYIPANRRDRVKEKHIRVYWNQLFPNRELRHWAWKYDVSGLLGGPRDKNIAFLVGHGGNSKTGHILLKETAWGDYLIKGDNKMILAHIAQKASGPEPEKIRMRGRRWMIFQELDGKEPLHGGNLRKLSGGDSQGGIRDAFDGANEMIEVVQMAKVAIMLNKLPPVSEGGSVEATWERFKVLYYDSKWTEAASDDYEEQWKTNRFKPSDDFNDRIISLAETYFSMLVSSWRYYWSGKPRLPDIAPIVEATKQYRSLTDLYLNYYTERIEISKKDDGSVDRSVKKSVTQLYTDFKNWYTMNFSKRPPPRNVFMEEMRAKGLIYEGNDYIGVKIKSNIMKESDDEEEDSGNESE